MFKIRLKTLSISLLLVTGISNASTPEQFIIEIHPETFYPVTLELKLETENEIKYEPIPETPLHSRNICYIKPKACTKSIPPPSSNPGSVMLQ